MGRIVHLTVHEDPVIQLRLVNDPQYTIHAEQVKIERIYPDPYDGPTQVRPKVNEEQVLQTKDKSMRSNVTVEAIPVQEVSNPSGGYTVYIGL